MKNTVETSHIQEVLTEKMQREEFKNMSIDNIESRYHSRPIAEALYEAEHSIDVDHVSLDQLFKEMDACWKL